MNKPTHKICPCCGRDLPLTDYYIDMRHEDLCQGYCKKCYSQKRRERDERKRKMYGEKPWYLK